ncbi:MAG: CvpA family protein [Alphaproteobacteria bacterium]|nr:CvpA family protein [Alphaproteobacteria bacterium]NNF73524.1 CvpA family protein [Paracoccaceae bacterium]
MDGFTIVDGGVALVILISAILAYSRGFVREIMAIVGWVAAAVAAFYLTPAATPLVAEVPILNEFLDGSCELSVLAAFIGVFAIALIILSIFVPLLSGSVQRSAVGGVDQGLGFLFGALRGVLLVVVALIVYDRVVIGEPIAEVEESRSAAIFAELQTSIAENIPAEVPGWIVDRYEDLVGECVIEEGEEPEAEAAPTGN